VEPNAKVAICLTLPPPAFNDNISEVPVAVYVAQTNIVPLTVDPPLLPPPVAFEPQPIRYKHNKIADK
jgi:hypothetical protein